MARERARVELGLQRADDAGDALVARPVQTEPLRELRIRRRRVHEWHAAVGDLRRHGAERDHHLRTGLLGDFDEQPPELPPVVMGLDPGQQHELATGVGLVVGVDGVLGPDDRAGHAVFQHDLRTDLLRIEERVAVDRRQPGGVGELDEVVDGARGRRRGVEVSRERDHQDRRASRPLPLPDELAHWCSLIHGAGR